MAADVDDETALLLWTRGASGPAARHRLPVEAAADVAAVWQDTEGGES